MNFEVLRLGPQDIALTRRLNALFAAVFDDPASYGSAPPADAYLGRVLAREQVIALVALEAGEVVEVRRARSHVDGLFLVEAIAPDLTRLGQLEVALDHR